MFADPTWAGTCSFWGQNGAGWTCSLSAWDGADDTAAPEGFQVCFCSYEYFNWGGVSF